MVFENKMMNEQRAMQLRAERDAEIAAELAAFDATLTLARPQHDFYSKALKALREHEACKLIQEAFEKSDADEIMLHGARYVRRADGQPDKPGTVRRPGVRRQFGSNRKQRWATV